MSTDEAQFVYMTCHPAAVAALKEEVGRTDPHWRFAFSRPGFITFKLPADQKWDNVRLAARSWVFAYAHGLSLGRITGGELNQMATELWQHEAVAKLLAEHRPADVHVWQREPAGADERGSEAYVSPLALEVERTVRAAAPDSCAALRELPTQRQPSPRNSRVLDVVLVEPNQWWIGTHRAATPTQRWPGGAIPVTMPETAVSRAYEKLAEALAWSGMPLAAGEECVEIGCAPGGASQALLDRGLFVTGIDPADVDPAVLANPRFRHLRKRGREVRRSEFEGVRWLATDMNIAPEDTLDTVESIVTHPGLAIRGMILTLKLSDWSEARRLPEFLERVQGWGYRDVRIRQLTTGGQEVCLAALRRKALRRLKRPRAAAAITRIRTDGPHEEPPGPHFQAPF